MVREHEGNDMIDDETIEDVKWRDDVMDLRGATAYRKEEEG